MQMTTQSPNAIIFYDTDGEPLITIHSDTLNCDQLLSIFDSAQIREHITSEANEVEIDNISETHGEFIES